MNRTLYKKIFQFFVLLVLACGIQPGARFSTQTGIDRIPQGVVKAQSDQPVYFPLVARTDKASSLVRRVNVPYFSDAIISYQAAVFWFGQVTSDQNYSDVRIAYSPTELFVRFAAFDRRIWYNKNETAEALKTLTDWDGMSLYLNLQGADPRQPLSKSYRFTVAYFENQDTMLSNHRAAYRGNGQSWQTIPISFTSRCGYRGNAPDDDVNDDGWSVTLHIPYSSLGLDGPPAQGTVWGMALDMYDRDSEAGPPNPAKRWPEASGEIGQIAFGVPGYTPARYTSPSAPLVLRQGLNGVSVLDAMVGGSSTCGEGLNRWTQWGTKNWYGVKWFVVQNQDDYADFPCFSKEYLTYPLDAVPPGKVIVSAKLVVYHFGNSDPYTAKDSYIQVMRVAEDWDPHTINWNNAPLALENYSATWVRRIGPDGVEIPGNPYEFDLSRAIADAYEEKNPLRIVLYDADSEQNSGKYFISSSEEDWDATGRPRLEIVWGDPK